MDYVQLPEPSLLQHQAPFVYLFTASEVFGMAMLIAVAVMLVFVVIASETK